jgi:hypothetical protein
MIDQKQPENVEYYNCLGSVITYGAGCTWEYIFSFAIAKTVFNNEKSPFTCKLDLNLMKKPVNCSIRNTTLYGVEKSTL